MLDPSFQPTLNLGELEPLLNKTLKAPLFEFGERPSKKFRKRLVRMAYQMVCKGDAAEATTPQIDRLGDMLESLHLGSLVIDDIQDGSTERRGGPALHLQMGMPQALCAGNWLYFKALNELRQLGLNTEQELWATRAFGDTMELAHCGQILDLSLKASTIPVNELPDICRQVSLLKTGCLTSFAVYGGALLGQGSLEQIELVRTFGLKFGLILQTCDDLGNAVSKTSGPKHFEDLILDKPSSLWLLAHRMEPKLVGSLRTVVDQKPFNRDAVEVWLTSHEFCLRALDLMEADIQEAFAPLRDPHRFHQKSVDQCFVFTKELLHAYT